MRRRDILAALGGAAIGWPLEAKAQQKRKLPVIGFLSPGFPPGSNMPRSTFYYFKEGLRKAGYVDGENVRIEVRWGQGKPETIAGLAEELVRISVDVLIAVARTSIVAAKAATRDIPIVAIDLESDPVASGFVASLAAPGGNLTGQFLDAPGLAAKWLQQISAIVPDARKMAVLWETDTGDYQLHALKAAATAMSIELQVLEFRGAAGMESALATGLKERPEALIQLGSPLINLSAGRIAKLTAAQRLPAISMFRTFPDSGGLMSYGPVLDKWYEFLGNRYVDAILKGAKPADLAVDRPTNFEMVLNLKAAMAMGLTIPPLMLAQADEVIE